MAGIYIHIPFCLRRCVYCDFYVEPLGTGPLSQRFGQIETRDNSNLITALEKENSLLPKNFSTDTLYIGGGTPTELSARDLTSLLNLGKSFGASDWTVEANPGTLSKEKAQLLFDYGVTRISLGAQSFDPGTLDYLTRIHSADEIIESYKMLRIVGFDNINLDLMFGLPGDSLDRVEADLDQLLALRPEHLSCYGLDYEPNTQLTALRNKGFIEEVDEEITVAQFKRIRERLMEAGYHHYEISNYALPNKESQHNLHTWNAGEYIGLGPAAASHWQGSRWRNLPDLKAYIDHIQNGTSARIEEETLKGLPKAKETLMIGLRKTEGVSLSWFKQHTGFDLIDSAGEALPQLICEGLLCLENDQLKLTVEGQLLSNTVFEALL